MFLTREACYLAVNELQIYVRSSGTTPDREVLLEPLEDDIQLRNHRRSALFATHDRSIAVQKCARISSARRFFTATRLNKIH
jgi:hypothetical protein